MTTKEIVEIFMDVLNKSNKTASFNFEFGVIKSIVIEPDGESLDFRKLDFLLNLYEKGCISRSAFLYTMMSETEENDEPDEKDKKDEKYTNVEDINIRDIIRKGQYIKTSLAHTYETKPGQYGLIPAGTEVKIVGYDEDHGVDIETRDGIRIDSIGFVI